MKQLKPTQSPAIRLYKDSSSDIVIVWEMMGICILEKE